MPRYWIISPVVSEPREQFDKAWQFDLTHNIISIGWAELGDPSKMSREQLEQAVASTYPDSSRGYITNTIRTFYHEVVPGDFVIARRGLKVLEAVGKVIQPAFYAPGKNPFLDHPNFLEVAWQDKPHEKVFSTSIFTQHTIRTVPEEFFHKLLEGSVPELSTSETSDEVEKDDIAFVLEKYLEDFIVSNFDVIFKKELVLYKDAEGKSGQQYPTEIGPIDILAVEPKSKSFVVIELKKGRSSDQVVGQTLRYMGWVKDELCKEGQTVKGRIICRDPDLRLSYALKMTKDIDIRYYEASFRLKETP